MYLRRLQLWNFRKYGSDTALNRDADLTMLLQGGLNLLVGENDSGKTSILDAIKIITLTRSNEYIRLQPEDFYHAPGTGQPVNRLKIECIFTGLNDDEAKNFIEWLSVREVNGKAEFYLRIFIEADLKGGVVMPYDLRAGNDDEGIVLTAGAKDLIRATYLKPLRDAETELSPKRNSRLSQILDSHDAFKNKVDHPLIAVVATANTAIKNYFRGINEAGEVEAGHAGKNITDSINTFLNDFFGRQKDSGFEISTQSLKNILEKLELILERGNNGLGSHNLLFIAAELLLLTRREFTGLRLALIEEIEAHLHPQAQLRLIEYLATDAKNNNIQLIITSHSPTLASKVSVANIVLCKDNWAYSLAPEFTELKIGDYAFLERFLDATKANLFFAQGVILVEGDAENILIPSIARIIGRDFTKYGVSVVNIGNTAFNRYSRIFKRTDGKALNISVACVTDNDIDLDAGLTPQEVEQNRTAKAAKYAGQKVKTFGSPIKTLEYDLSLGVLQQDLYRSALFANKLKNSDQYGVTFTKYKQVKTELSQQVDAWQQAAITDEQKARHILGYIASRDLKSITAQFFALLLEHRNRKEDMKAIFVADPYFEYIIQAIEYVTEPLNQPQNVQPNNG